MNFAVLNSDLSYWQKQTQPLFPNLAWNIPEQKTGNLAIVGGNSQTFSTVVRISEYANKTFPFSSVKTYLPDALRGKLPTLTNLEFLPSTASGSFAKSFQLDTYIAHADATLIIGDLSKNSATAIALADAISEESANSDSSTPNLESSNPKPLVITRDSVDLLAPEAGRWLLRANTFVVASMIQLQKLFRAVYYPRMILLSQPLIPVLETLHKFTLTYPVTIVTFQSENIIVAHGGNITTTKLTNTSYSPLTLWSGQLATKILALNLYNPNKPLEATTAALLYAP